MLQRAMSQPRARRILHCCIAPREYRSQRPARRRPIPAPAWIVDLAAVPATNLPQEELKSVTHLLDENRVLDNTSAGTISFQDFAAPHHSGQLKLGDRAAVLRGNHDGALLAAALKGIRMKV